MTCALNLSVRRNAEREKEREGVLVIEAGQLFTKARETILRGR